MSVSAAQKLFAAFHGRKPRKGDVVTVAMKRPAAALMVGELEGVIYRASSDGEKYIHEFKKNARPALAVSHDGKQIYILAGGYEFTDRGFEDKAPKRRVKK